MSKRKRDIFREIKKLACCVRSKFSMKSFFFLIRSKECTKWNKTRTRSIFFREINFIVISLAKTLIWRKNYTMPCKIFPSNQSRLENISWNQFIDVEFTEFSLIIGLSVFGQNMCRNSSWNRWLHEFVLRHLMFYFSLSCIGCSTWQIKFGSGCHWRA